MRFNQLFPTSAVLFLLIAPASAIESDDEAFIIQTDIGDGTALVIPLGEDGGSFTAAMPVSEAGSIFELFARGTAWDNNLYLLDTQIVGAFSPVVSMVLKTEDPYIRGNLESGNYVRRTRADRPYSLHYEVSGLVPVGTANATEAETSVGFRMNRCLFDLVSYSGVGSVPEEVSGMLLYNGSNNIEDVYHELLTPWRDTVCGEHVFTFERHATDGIPVTILAESRLEIWPVATATIANIEPNGVYIDRISTMIVNLTHLYPDSRTFTHIYRGEPGNPEGEPTLLGSSERKFGLHYNPEQPNLSTGVPQTLSIHFNDLSNYTPTDGVYTVEVWTETPFFNRAPEYLAGVTFKVDRLISSRGQIITAEESIP